MQSMKMLKSQLDHEGGRVTSKLYVYFKGFVNIILEIAREPLSDIPMERNPVYSAGPQPPTGGDGLVVLENPAYSLPRDPHTPPGTPAASHCHCWWR